MRKFTVFTVILTIIIIVVVAEIVVNEYLPDVKSEEDLTFVLPESLDLSRSIETNVLGNDGLSNYLGADYSEDAATPEVLDTATADVPDSVEISTVSDIPVVPTVAEILPTTEISGLKDFEDTNFAAPATSVYLREDHIKSAGFVGAYLESEQNDGQLFKSIFIDDLYDVEVTKTLIRTTDQLLAKVYVFKMGIAADINEVYNLLKLRASEGNTTEVNETNEFGLSSFYMNDSMRTGTAFLTVRIGGLIYAFSYPKDYHSQIKNLIQLLSWELSN